MIYFIQCGKNGPIKIGSSDEPDKRMEQLQVGCPYELKMLWKYRENGDNTADYETREVDIHKKFQHERVRGEWFHPSRDLVNFISAEMENSITVTFVNFKEFIDITEYPNGPISINISEKCWMIYNPETGKVDIDYV